MVRTKVAFLQSADENVLATLQLVGGVSGLNGREFTITEYTDENELLQAIVLARLDDETTIELTSRVLLSVANIPQEQPWVNVIAGRATYASLGLRMPSNEPVLPAEHPNLLEKIDMNIALEQTPIPLCLLEGPEHVCVFANEAYVKIAQRTSRYQLLGKPVREQFSAEEGKDFFGLLDETYRTGKTYVGTEVPISLYSDITKQVVHNYFDFVYQPIRDVNGDVCGILSQGIDVTERVLDKQVREAREKQLFQQWAELDALYRTSPLGMVLLRASDFTIQRLNDIQASLLGGKAEELVGRRILDFYPNDPFVGDVLRRVVRDKVSCTLEVNTAPPAAPGKPRKWTWNLHPILNARGAVESIASITLEIADHPNDPAHFLEEEASECSKA